MAIDATVSQSSVSQVQHQVLTPSRQTDLAKHEQAVGASGSVKSDQSAVAALAPDASKVQTAQAPKPKQGEKELEEAVDRLRQFATSTRRDMEISVDKTSGKFVVKVLDSMTKEVVRQIPSEDLLRVARQLDSNDKGGLLEATA